MSETIYRRIDVEDAIRSALDPYMEAYCRPLPEKFAVPCVLIQGTGGDTEAAVTGTGKIDTFVVVVDSRADIEADALEQLRNAVAILEATKDKGFSHVAVNSLYSWGMDPTRPDLAMCSATLTVTAHREAITLD